MSSASDPLPLLTRPARHLFLSPHYDDVPLSAGATVRLLADHGLIPETLVVFGSEPDRDRPLSAFAEAMHERWGLTRERGDRQPASRGSRRRRRAGSANSRPALSGRHLPRRLLPVGRGSLWLSGYRGGVPAHRICRILDLTASPDATIRIYAPLGVGKHVDHQIVHLAGPGAGRRGWDVWFYEDIPYALRPMALDARLAEMGRTRLERVARIPAESTWDRKIDAILRYPSQLETVFLQYVGVGTTREEISEALSTYATRAGDGVRAERFWRLSDAPDSVGS